MHRQMDNKGTHRCKDKVKYGRANERVDEYTVKEKNEGTDKWKDE